MEVLINTPLPFMVERVHLDNMGQFLWVAGSLWGSPIVFCSVYAPTQSLLSCLGEALLSASAGLTIIGGILMA